MDDVKSNFRGEIEEVKADAGKSVSAGPKSIDLREMGRRAINYFLRTPRPERDYACRFSNSLDKCPPGSQGEDLVAYGDTDVRNDSVLPGLRRLSGLTDSTDVDEGLHKRILGFIGDDGLSHSLYAMCCAGDMPPDTTVTSLWTTGWTIRSITERNKRCFNLQCFKRGHKLSRPLPGS